LPTKLRRSMQDVMAAQSLFFDHALLADGWARDVRVDVADGAIVAVAAGASRAGAEIFAGIAVPGMPNLHCHAFQRAMAGLAERRGPARDSFWTWREVMYRFLAVLTPDDVEAIAAFAYMEMLEAGFTSVGEFHYLHHDPDGHPYADLGEMAARIVAAAAETGIGLTLLPSLYMSGGFGGVPPTAGQRRFLNDPDRFLDLLARTREIAARLAHARIGIAPHSLRAVPTDALRRVVEALPEGPVHIHAAEQVKEVEDCIAATGARPVEWLLRHAQVDARWCLVHATHMTARETEVLARSGAVAGLCPLTEASLGDGIFNGVDYLAAGGRFGVGTDSNIQIDVAAELRQLEYSQRLAHRGRNMMAIDEGESIGWRLHTTALAAGAQALDRPVGTIAPRHHADIVVLDATHPDLAASHRNGWLDAWIFVAGRAAVGTVIVDGRAIVEHGRHRLRDPIVKRYKAVLERVASE
jgi:formimidoylglutamate deiminase